MSLHGYIMLSTHLPCSFCLLSLICMDIRATFHKSQVFFWMTWVETRLLILWAHVFRFKQFHVIPIISHGAFFFDWTSPNCHRDRAQNERIWQPLNCRYPFSSLAHPFCVVVSERNQLVDVQDIAISKAVPQLVNIIFIESFFCQRVTNQILLYNLPWFS